MSLGGTELLTKPSSWLQLACPLGLHNIFHRCGWGPNILPHLRAFNFGLRGTWHAKQSGCHILTGTMQREFPQIWWVYEILIIMIHIKWPSGLATCNLKHCLAIRFRQSHLEGPASRAILSITTNGFCEVAVPASWILENIATHSHRWYRSIG